MMMMIGMVSSVIVSIWGDHDKWQYYDGLCEWDLSWSPQRLSSGLGSQCPGFDYRTFHQHADLHRWISGQPQCVLSQARSSTVSFSTSMPYCAPNATRRCDSPATVSEKMKTSLKHRRVSSFVWSDRSLESTTSVYPCLWPTSNNRLWTLNREWNALHGGILFGA